jgi:hypothetical protein
MKNSEIWNLAEPSEKHRLMRQISSLPAGLYDVLIKPRRFTRSLEQNSYYWVAVVAPFVEWLKEHYGDPHITAEQAHEMLKVKILGLQHGVLVPRSKTLDVEEFSHYIEGAAAWLAEFCEIVVIPSDLFHSNSKGQET